MGIGLAVSRKTGVKVGEASRVGVSVAAPPGTLQATAARHRISNEEVILSFEFMVGSSHHIGYVYLGL